MEDEEHGVPEWVVTYGDMMSLLLTFFIMLVSLSDVVAEEKYQAILSALHKKLGYETAAHTPPGEHFPLNGLMANLESLGSFTDEDDGYGGIRHRSTEGNELKVYRTREGEARIAVRPVFYPPFVVEISDDERPKLVEIAAELAGKPNKVVIRVFASKTPLPAESRYADKIALTYERGRNVFRFLVAQGVDYKRLRIDAMSDTSPLSQTDDKNSARLDRVEVIILNAFADEFVGPREAPH
jgi:chemotaxis protein MotB